MGEMVAGGVAEPDARPRPEVRVGEAAKLAGVSKDKLYELLDNYALVLDLETGERRRIEGGWRKATKEAVLVAANIGAIKRGKADWSFRSALVSRLRERTYTELEDEGRAWLAQELAARGLGGVGERAAGRRGAPTGRNGLVEVTP
jgi:hypothetical protein